MAMTKPLSLNDIGNMALIRLKQEPSITNLDPPKTDVENLVAEVITSIRRAALRAYPWNFAIKRLAITADAVAPEFGYAKAFTFPSDFLRYLTRHDTEGFVIIKDRENYQIEKGKLLLNDEDQTTVRIRYIYDHTIVAQWDPLFVEVMVLELAIALASNFTGGKGWVASLKQDLLRAQTQARAIDGQERPPVRREHSNWVRSRRGRGGIDITRVNFK